MLSLLHQCNEKWSSIIGRERKKKQFRYYQDLASMLDYFATERVEKISQKGKIRS